MLRTHAQPFATTIFSQSARFGCPGRSGTAAGDQARAAVAWPGRPPGSGRCPAVPRTPLRVGASNPDVQVWRGKPRRGAELVGRGGPRVRVVTGLGPAGWPGARGGAGRGSRSWARAVRGAPAFRTQALCCPSCINYAKNTVLLVPLLSLCK